ADAQDAPGVRFSRGGGPTANEALATEGAYGIAGGAEIRVAPVAGVLARLDYNAVPSAWGAYSPPNPVDCAARIVDVRRANHRGFRVQPTHTASLSWWTRALGIGRVGTSRR